MEILHIENLSFRYPQTEKAALEDISFSLKKGEFAVIGGSSGSGKSTLLKLIKQELAPFGEKKGTVFFNGTPIETLSARDSASKIGFVMQNPDNQIVTDRVWHELVFGAENLGLPSEVIRRRVGEMASYFGIEKWFRRETDSLSGGEKQLLSLAAVMVMQPQLLLLDEPTAQLDPIAAADFIQTLERLNRELGITVLLAEHRLEEVLPLADQVILLEDGKIQFEDTPRKVCRRLAAEPDHPLFGAMPSAVRIYRGLGKTDGCPLTVREGKQFLETHFEKSETTPALPAYQPQTPRVAELENVYCRYERSSPDILRGATLSLYAGECFCLLGGNGSGKTTLLRVLAGLQKPYRGGVRVAGKPISGYKGNSLYRKMLAMLPQNPQTVFLKETVETDLAEMLAEMPYTKAEKAEKIRTVATTCGVAHLLSRHPLDLSGGEQQKCALAKLLLAEPKLLLLDEPTKGLDAFSKEQLREILKRLQASGVSILLVTHDVEFAAQIADRCALLFDGEILSADTPSRFFAENAFYTTAANRMAREVCPWAITCDEVVAFCRENEVRHG